MTWEGYQIGPVHLCGAGVAVARRLERGGGWLRFLPRISEGPGVWVTWHPTRREAVDGFGPVRAILAHA